MTTGIVINADDLGLTPGVSAGISESIMNGVVTSTTAMVCVEGAEEDVKRASARIGQRIGMHLQLTGGRPCLPPSHIPTLVGADGLFRRHRHELRNACPSEIAQEWQAQIARLRSWGVSATHLDSHHHVHTLPEALPVFIDLARTSGLPARAGDAANTRQLRAAGIRCPAALIMLSHLPTLSPALVLGRIRLAARLAGPDCVVELGCHPGRSDGALEVVSSYTGRRDEELALLTSQDLRRTLEQQGVQLTCFADLP
jgi:predicted glycoside hydrolase/deacetylase ChbG (UPF0249 family)